MSWLYTLIFAGLAFSSSQDPSPLLHLPEVPEVAITQPGVQETERFDQSYPFSPTGKVNLNNVNGSVVLEAWDRNEVRVQYAKTVSSKERLSQAQVRIDARPDQLNINTEFVGWTESGKDEADRNFGTLVVEFHLTVPRTAILNNIEVVNGNVTLSKFTNFARVSVVNGQVLATNLRGTAKLSTVNGELRASLDKLESGTQLSLETVMGAVNLTIPSDASAVIKAGTLNGPISNDLGLPVRHGKYVGHDLYGRLGGGEVPIKLSSVNGSLNIIRRTDGRAAPVTNLLNMKGGEDDPDFDVDIDEDETPPGKVSKANKDATKAVKDSQKNIDNAAKTLSKDIQKIKPVIVDATKSSVELAADAIADAAKAVDSTEWKAQVDALKKGQWDLFTKGIIWDFGGGAPQVEETTESFAVKGTPKVTIEAPGCAVSIRAWDRPEVQYRAVQYSRIHSGSAPVVAASRTDSSVTLRVSDAVKGLGPGSFFGRGTQTRIEIFVPQKADLKVTATGEIRLEGVAGTAELFGMDEPVNVRDSSGTLRVKSGDGRVRVIGFRGDVNTNTSDGDTSLEGVFTSLVARSADGRIVLTLPHGVNAEIESNSPDIQGNGLRFERIEKAGPINTYKLGTGGAKFQLWTDGDIEIRNADVIKGGS